MNIVHTDFTYYTWIYVHWLYIEHGFYGFYGFMFQWIIVNMNDHESNHELSINNFFGSFMVNSW